MRSWGRGRMVSTADSGWSWAQDGPSRGLSPGLVQISLMTYVDYKMLKSSVKLSDGIFHGAHSMWDRMMRRHLKKMERELHESDSASTGRVSASLKQTRVHLGSRQDIPPLLSFRWKYFSMRLLYGKSGLPHEQTNHARTFISHASLVRVCESKPIMPGTCWGSEMDFPSTRRDLKSPTRQI